MNVIWKCEGHIDASDLGLSVGQWPQHLHVRCDDGQTRTFTRSRALVGHNAGYVYTHGDTHVLTVRND